MLTLIWLLLGLLGGAFGLLVLAIVLPMHFAFSAQAGGANRARVSVRPFGGIIPRIVVFDTTRDRKPGKPKKAATPAPEKKKRKKRRFRPSGETVWRMIGAAPDLIMGEMRRFHIDRFCVDADFGLGDPAATGELYGWMCPLLYGTPLRRMDVTLRPDFARARFDGRLDGALHFTPIALLGPVIRFGWRVFVMRK